MNHENGTVAMVTDSRESVMNGSTGRRATRPTWMAAAMALAVALAGCNARPPEPTAAPAQAKAGAVGGKAALAPGPQCGGTDPHTKHIDLAVGCAACHPCGAVFGFDVPYSYPRGTTTAGGTLNRGIAPVVTTCTVACHSPMGAPAKSVSWDAGPRDCVDCHVTSTFPAAHPAIANPSPTGADCLGCHVTTNHGSGTVTLAGHLPSWMDQASLGFHAYEANKGLGKCQGCHASDLSGGFTGFSCAQCHNTGLPSGVANWSVNCVMCHGGTNDQTGAPPKATWGNSADAVRVGAHAIHLAGTATSPGVSCASCHVRPGDAFAAGHVDGGAAEITWGGLAVARGATPAWNRAAGTCSNTYCHGSFPNGNAANAPVWTAVGGGQAACGTCHGLPPGGTHPSVGAALTGCAACHSTTMSPDGSLVAVASGGTHLDGTIQASGGHPTGWMDTASPSFHAFSAAAGIASCQSCHGVNLDGVGGTAVTSCATCHGATWQTNCTMCHGGIANQTGAPPKGTWGFRTDAARIGAHTKHLTAGAIAGATPCAACHVVPASATSAGHMNGSTATVTWSGLPASGGATPAYDPATKTCSNTYCHGGFQGTYNYDFWGPASVAYAGSKATPTWNGGAMTCTSCHQNPPANGAWHDGLHGGGNACNLCHAHVNATGTAILNPALHMNGTIDVNPAWKSSCFNCH